MLSTRWQTWASVVSRSASSLHLPDLHLPDLHLPDLHLAHKLSALHATFTKTDKEVADVAVAEHNSNKENKELDDMEEAKRPSLMSSLASKLCGWCESGASSSSDLPEIKFCVDQAVLKTPAPALPMPDSAEEIDTKFNELVAELDLSETNRSAMMLLPKEKKWQLYCSQRHCQQQASKEHEHEFVATSPEAYIAAVDQLTQQMSSSCSSTTSTLDALHIALRTQPHSFVTRFVDASGLDALLNFLANMDEATSHSAMHTAVLACLKALMNNSTGRCAVLSHSTGVTTIAQSLLPDQPRTKVAVLELLGAMCIVRGGHTRVLQAMQHYQSFACERVRFQGVMSDLERTTETYRDSLALKTAAMSFVNAILNYGPGEEHLEFRMHLRFEFIQLGIKSIIQRLRKLDNETLNRHLDFFDLMQVEDEKELCKRYDSVSVDVSEPRAMFELILQKLSNTQASIHFNSMLQHCILLPLEYATQPHYWLLLDRVVQQIAVQSATQDDHDLKVVEIDVQSIIKHLATESELRALEERASSASVSLEMVTKELAVKEAVLAAVTQEKEDLQANLERTKDRLELELTRRQEERHDNETTSTSTTATRTSSSSIAAPPPPPPPPSAPSALRRGVVTDCRRCVPMAKTPLKSFNWSKLPDCKVEGTIWTEIDESNLYTILNLKEVDTLFSAYQKNGLYAEGSLEDVRNNTLGRRAKIISVIDSRRAQNCTILLSKLKMTNDDISAAIMSMDANEEFPADMVEQMLKFTPTPEERALLDDHADEIEQLARADRFLFELSKITHYEQRLRTLLYKKKFHVWLSEARPKIVAVLEASKEVQRSKRLRRMLEIILAFGNYMNRGQRGNAGGFKLSSLTRIGDTKSGCNKGLTLLHYIADQCDSKFRECLMLEADLPHVREAAKVNLKELEKDVSQLRTGMKEAQREIEFFRCHQQQQQQQHHEDRYLPVMKEFVSRAAIRLAELEDLFIDMRARFDHACKLFCEDPATTSSDDLFGAFDAFLCGFEEARADNEAARRKREEEQKMAKQQQELRMRTLERKRSSSLQKRSSNPQQELAVESDQTQFDDLISALRTADVFGHDRFTRTSSRSSLASNSNQDEKQRRFQNRERAGRSPFRDSLHMKREK